MARAKKERITQPHWINMANGIDVIDKGGTLYVNSMEKFWEVLNAYVDNLCGSPYIKYKFDGHRVEGQYFTYCNNGGVFHGEGDVIKLSVGIYVNQEALLPDLNFIENGNPNPWSSAFNMPQYKRDRLKKKVEDALEKIPNLS